MTKKAAVPASDEAWESRELGSTEAFVAKAEDNIETVLDGALDLQLISIRLQKSLIEDFKYIAALNGIGYQPLMRQILQRFADSEKKKILRDMAYEALKAREEASQGPSHDVPGGIRKTA